MRKQISSTAVAAWTAAYEKGTFNAWMRQVDRVIDRIAGVSYEDLTDQPYREWYDAGTSPKRAAARALADNGF